MEEVQLTGQGTRLSERNPWETYGEELDLNLSPEMAAAVAEYAEHVYESGETSNQNKEELHRQQEINDDLAKEYQFLTEEEYANVEERIGRVMHAVSFLDTLKKGGVNCWYAAHPHLDKCKLVVTDREGLKEPETVCWVPIGYMPELSIMRFDGHGVPLNERRRGWRTCLLQVILKSVLSEEKAVKLFGPPGQSEAFDRYNATLYEWRHNRFTVA